MGKNKQVHKTKDELIADLKANADWLAKMKFVKEQFYPALCAASTSVEDAVMLLSGFNNQLMESFLRLMKEKKVSDLGLEEKLDKESSKYVENLALLKLFEGMSIFDCKTHVEGMKGDIEKFKFEEFQNRDLSSLRTRWMDEI